MTGYDQFPQTESAAQVHAARAGKQDRVEGSAGGFRDERHHGNEEKSAESRSDVVHDRERWWVHECVPLGAILQTVAESASG